jgi:hypothetical protein
MLIVWYKNIGSRPFYVLRIFNASNFCVMLRASISARQLQRASNHFTQGIQFLQKNGADVLNASITTPITMTSKLIMRKIFTSHLFCLLCDLEKATN